MVPITQNINFAPCDRFSQITSHINKFKKQNNKNKTQNKTKTNKFQKNQTIYDLHDKLM